jgi:pyrimidine deaminase RibD-like protein
VTYTYNGSTTVPTTAGTYTVVATINDPNYQGSTTGTLVIGKATTGVSVSLGNLTQSYTGSPLTPTVTTTPSGLAVTYTYNGSTTVPTTAGTYTVVATINDPNYQGSTTGTLVIAKATTGVSVALGNLTQSYTGSPLSATATTTPSGLAVTYTYNGSTTVPTTAGTYTVVATINDPNYQGSTTGTLVIAKATTGVSVTLGSLSQTYTGSPLTPTVTTTPSGLAVTYTYNGSATPPTATGSYTVVATINDPNYQGTATGTLVIAKATAGVSATSNSNPVLVQNSITLTATVNSTVSTPTGTVTFLDGTTPLGTGTVNSSGIATLAISTLAVGSHSITEVYSGDTNFTTASSSALLQMVQDFNLTISIASSGGTAGVTSVTALPGGTAVYTFTLSPVGSTTFPAIVTLSATGLPTGATYTFSPATLAAGTGSTQVTLTVNLPQLSAMNLLPTVQHAATPAEVAQNKPSSKLPFLALGLLLLPFTRRMRRASRKLGRLLPLLLLLMGGLAAISSLSGCGSSSGYFGQSPATYTITVTGTSGALVHSTSVTLTVQ